MQNRYRMYRRSGTIYYAKDKTTGRTESLGTADRAKANACLTRRIRPLSSRTSMSLWCASTCHASRRRCWRGRGTKCSRRWSFPITGRRSSAGARRCGAPAARILRETVEGQDRSIPAQRAVNQPSATKPNRPIKATAGGGLEAKRCLHGR